jgi:transcriptional activator SPT8
LAASLNNANECLKSASVPPQDVDTKSEASFDPLFDDEPDAEGDPDHDSNPLGPIEQATPAPQEVHPPTSFEYGMTPNFAAPDRRNGPKAQTSYLNGRGALGIIAPPKNAPPLLDPSTYTTYSPDILMTASIDGQVILWDRRVETTGQGVGRLWMNEKTPPWCLSVSPVT